ncbi:MAG: hypothetical protein ACI4E1_05420 [Lachnospira sp.]
MSRIIRFLELFLQMQVFLAAMIGVNIGMLGKSDDSVWESCLILITVVICYLTRRKIKSFMLLVVLHVAMTIVTVFFAHNDAELVFYFLTVGIICAYSLWIKMILVKRTEYMNNVNQTTDITDESVDERSLAISASEHISVFACLVMVAFCFVANMKTVNNILLQNIEVTFFVIFILTQIVYNQVKEISRAFVFNRGKAEFPKKQIVRTNVSIISVVCVFMILGMFLFYKGKYGNIFSLLGFAFLGVIKLVLKWVLKLWGSGPEDETNELPAETGSGSSYVPFEGDSSQTIQNNPSMSALVEVFFVLLVIAVVVMIIIMIKKYSDRFRKTKFEDGDEIEFLDRNTDKSGVAERVKKQEDDAELNLNKKYRKLYKKYAASGKGSFAGKSDVKPDQTMMPEDLTRQRITDDNEASRKITDSYEIARYSDKSVTKEELDYLKKLKNR